MGTSGIGWKEVLEMAWVGKTVKALIIIVSCWLLFLLIRNALRKFDARLTRNVTIRESETTLRLKTFSHLLQWLGSILTVALGAYMLLQNFGIDVAPLLAGAGIIGLAFGFGGQYLIRDVINGVFILLEGQYRVNDVVKIGEYSGLVEAVNLRITQLRDLEGRVIYIPNGEIKAVVNFTKDYANAVLEIGVAYKEKVDQVMTVIKEIGSGMRADPYFSKLILADLEMLGVENFGDSQVTIKFRVRTLPIKQWEVAREFRRRIKNRFDELGIEIPFPHRTLYWGSAGAVFSDMKKNQ